MFGDRYTSGTPRWTVFTLTLILTPAVGAVVGSVPVAAQTGGFSNIRVQPPAGLPEDVILVFGTMTVLAIAVMVTFGHFASRSGGNSAAQSTVSEGSGEPQEGADALHEQQSVENVADKNERSRAVVTFDPDTASETEGDNLDMDREKSPDDAGYGERLRLRTILSAVFGNGDTDDTPDTPSAVKEGGNNSAVAESTETANPVHDTTDTRVDDDETSAASTVPPDENGQSTVERVRAFVTAVSRVIRGRVRMFCDRRALDLRAYGAEDAWTALTFEYGETSPDIDRELLEEVVYVGAVPIEIATESESTSEEETAFVDHTDAHLPVEARVHFPRRSVEWVETAAQAGSPEAKRTVTLLRRALQAPGSSPIENVRGR